MRQLPIVIGGVFLFMAGVVLAAGFSDTRGHRFEAQINELRGKGVFQGYDDGTFRPEKLVNRAEFLKTLLFARFGSEWADADTDLRCFADFVGPIQWFWHPACAAKELEIIHGYPDGSFGGDRTINLVEALKMAVQTFSIPLPVYVREPDHWYDPYIDAVAGRGIFELVPSDPAHAITRGEMAALMIALMPRGDEEFPEEEPPTDDGGTCVNCSNETIRHAFLLIDQETAGTGSAVVGKKDALLLAFQAAASRQDVILTTLKFRAQVGGLNAATNYRLYTDEDGDGITEKLAGYGKVAGTTLTFGNLQVEVEDRVYERMEVRADLALPGTSIGLAFATNDLAYVHAIGAVDGRDLQGIVTNGIMCTDFSTCWITVYTKSPRVLTLGEMGDLFVTKDAQSPGSRQLLLSSRSESILRLQMRAENEAILLTRIAIGGMSDSVEQLELWEDGATKAAVVLRSSSCGAIVAGQFCAASANGVFTVPANMEKDINVRAVLKSDANGGSAGGTVAATLSAATSGNVAIEARGVSSETVLDQNDGDSHLEGEIFIGRDSAGANVAITGGTHDIVAAKISSITNSSPDPDGTAVPSGVSAIGQFRFSAASHQNSQNGLNNVTITDVVFTMSALNITVDSFALYNKANPGITFSCSANGSTGTITVTCADIATGLGGGAEIDQDGSIDLVLRGTVTIGSGSGTRQLQVSLQQLGNRTVTGTVEWNDDSVDWSWVDLSESTVRSTAYRS